MSKKYDNLNATTSIQTMDEKYTLSCLMDEDGNLKTDWCFLELPKTVKVRCWDSTDFLWDQLYKTVKSYTINKQITIDFEDIIQDIPVEDFKVIYELLEFGIKLGFKKDGE